MSAPGAITVRSVSIASLVALSAGNWIMSSSCQPKPALPREQRLRGREPGVARSARSVRPKRSKDSGPRVRLNDRSAVTVVPAGIRAANGMCSRPPCVDGSAAAEVKCTCRRRGRRSRTLTTILLPSRTVGAVFAVSRKTSSVIGLSGVNKMCSVPVTVLRSLLTTNVNLTLRALRIRRGVRGRARRRATVRRAGRRAARLLGAAA